MTQTHLLTRIMAHEWRQLTADRTVALVVGLFAVVIGYGVFQGASWVSLQRRTLVEVETEERERLDALEARIGQVRSGAITVRPFEDPTNPASVGSSLGPRYAILPPAPLAALAVGQSDLYPYYFRVSTRSKDTFLGNDEIENPLNLLSGRFDLAFVLVYLYPLLILALSYNLIAGEREDGTLAMLLSQPVSLRTYVTGKVGLRAGVVLVTAITFSLGGFILSGQSGLGRDALALRLLLWTSVVGVYGLFWCAVAVVANAIGRHSATNAVALAAVWLALVVVVPSIVNVAATTLYPVPSRVQMMQATREASDEASAQGSQLLAQYYEDHPEMAGGQADLDAFAVQSYAVQEDVARRVQPVMARFDDQLFRQQQFVTRFRYLSPALVAQEALNDISGTSVARYRDFLAQVDRYHRVWQEFFMSRAVRKVRLATDEVSSFPRFTFTEESGSAIARRVASGVTGLAIPLLALAGFAATRLRRYAVTG